MDILNYLIILHTENRIVRIVEDWQGVNETSLIEENDTVFDRMEVGRIRLVVFYGLFLSLINEVVALSHDSISFIFPIWIVVKGVGGLIQIPSSVFLQVLCVINDWSWGRLVNYHTFLNVQVDNIGVIGERLTKILIVSVRGDFNLILIEKEHETQENEIEGVDFIVREGITHVQDCLSSNEEENSCMMIIN